MIAKGVNGMRCVWAGVAPGGCGALSEIGTPYKSCTAKRVQKVLKSYSNLLEETFGAKVVLSL
jgi:hypothetical protein